MKSFYSLLLTLTLLTLTSPQSFSQTQLAVNLSQLTINKEHIKFEHGIYCGLKDSKGMLWFGSIGSGVYHFDGKTFTHFLIEGGPLNNQVTAIMEDQDGKIWFGTNAGLYYYAPRTNRNCTVFIHLPLPFKDTSSLWLDKVYPIINPNGVHSLAQDQDGNIWIGTGGAGVYRYAPYNALNDNNNRFTQYLADVGMKYEDSLHHNWVPHIIADGVGNVWFSSLSHAGVNRFDGERFTQFMPKDGLGHDMIRALFKDRAGNFWFGFNGDRRSSLNKYDGLVFTQIGKKKVLGAFIIRAIYEDNAGNLWLGGVNKLVIYDPSQSNKATEFKAENGENFPEILFIMEDAEGHIWLGGKNGLWQFDGKTVTDMTL